ncbi:MAG: hypothetical protein ABSE73_16085 [Planctomycetota bacterium]
MPRLSATCCCLLFALPALVFAEEKTTDKAPVPEKADFPKDTIVSAYLNVPHDAGKNIVWCSTIQLAWDALGQELCGGPVRLEGTPQMEVELNKGQASKEDLDAESYLVRAGPATKEFIEKLNGDLKQKFGADAPAPVQFPWAVESPVFAYAYLFKKLLFGTPFLKRDALAWQAQNGRGTKVRSFGTGGKGEASGQVRVLDYVGRGNFVLALQTKSQADRLIVAVVAPAKTLEQTLAAVRERVAHAKGAALLDDDIFQMPNIAMDLNRNYEEVMHRHVLNLKDKVNTKEKGDSIVAAYQTVRFRLDDRGVELKSEAGIGWAAADEPEPRWLVFDRPFLLYLERVGAKAPYFALWVENPELLEKPDPASKPAEGGTAK